MSLLAFDRRIERLIRFFFPVCLIIPFENEIINMEHQQNIIAPDLRTESRIFG